VDRSVVDPYGQPGTVGPPVHHPAPWAHPALHEFRRVTLPEPARRCFWCIYYAHFNGKWTSHDRWHHDPSDHRLPQQWLVASELHGDRIEVGVTLRVVAAFHQVFWEDSLGSDSVIWLLEPVDGVDAGEIYSVWTWADRDEGNGYGVGLWPAGLDLPPTGP
jgi:hypothetical protein